MMARKKHALLSALYLKNRQNGAVLILMAFILGLGVAAYLMKTLDAASLRAKQDAKTYQVLKEAKVALIAWAANHPNVPGMMPFPDRNGDGNYDGNSDCYTGFFQNSFLLGQLPTVGQTNPCVAPQTALGGDWQDGQGNRLWYAVSRNLVHDYEHGESPIINPGMINPNPVTGFYAPTPYLRQGGTTSYPWLKVLDRNGNLISDRVAAVIIAPGDPVGAQNRSLATPNASEFLDSFKIGAANYKNSDSALDDEDFIMGEDSRNTSSNDNTFVQPYNFNDKLVYITIDELMAALEKRVGEQARVSLKAYQDANGYYPYAAKLGTMVMYSGEQNLLSGFLPVNPQKCSYIFPATLNCSQPIFDTNTSAITEVRYYGNSVFTSFTPACTISSGNRCYCTGVGSCSNNTVTFSCGLANCGVIGAGATGSIRIRGGKLTSSLGGCGVTNAITKDIVSGCPITTTSRITCALINGSFSSHGNGDASLDTYLPIWFNQNQWGRYIYYQLTRPANSNINVGNKTTEAVIITTGRPINSAPFTVKGAAQTQPSCNDVRNYLDTAENTDGDAFFEATSKQKLSNYNDQTFVVAP